MVYVFLRWPTHRHVCITCLCHVTLMGSCNSLMFNARHLTCVRHSNVQRWRAKSYSSPHTIFVESPMCHSRLLTPTTCPRCSCWCESTMVSLSQTHLSSQPRHYGSSWTLWCEQLLLFLALWLILLSFWSLHAMFRLLQSLLWRKGLRKTYTVTKWFVLVSMLGTVFTPFSPM